MDINQAWQAILGQLQMEMPRGSFDTWVRDTKPLSYETGLLTVGVKNAYARDWLEDRLTSTVSRLLIGIMNQTVDVVFVVDVQKDSLDEDNDDGEEEEKTFSVQSAESEEKTERESTEMEFFSLEPDPELDGLVTVVSGYLMRLASEIGAKAAWLFVANVQTFFDAGVRGNLQSGKPVRAIGSTAVMENSIFSERAFWRVLKSELPKMGGILEKVERQDDEKTETYRRGKRTLRRRLPDRYRIYFTPRLIRLDAAWVYLYLSAAESIETGLREITRLSRKELKEALYPLGSQAPDIEGLENMLFVGDIVRALTGDEAELSAELSNLTDKVHLKITSLWGKLFLSHFFMYRMIPFYKLTAHQAWLLAVARSRGYLNSQTGEMRSEVSFPGGYAEMATLCGMASWKGGAAWLRDYKGSRGGVLELLMREIPPKENTGFGRMGESPRSFWVQLDDEEIPPLESNGSLVEESNGSLVEESNGSLVEESNGSLGITCFSALPSNIKYLKLPLNTIKHPQTRTGGAGRGGGSDLSFVSWNWKILFKLNPGLRKEVRNRLESLSDPAALVSWLLYAYSPDGEGIRNPSLFATSKLKDDPESVAPQAYLNLAQLGPDIIRKKISEQLSQSEGGRDIDQFFQRRDDPTDWYLLFGKLSHARLGEMSQHLFAERVSQE